MDRPNGYKKVNTFSRTPCFNQIISYLVLATQSLSFWLLVQRHFAHQNTRFIMIAAYGLSTIVLLWAGVLASASDPSDPIMISYKNGKSSSALDSSQSCLYCEHCESYVISTSRHCKICDRCVDRFDHHCIWINNCIGRDNYSTFMVMIVAVFIHMLVYLIAVGLLWSEGQWREFTGQMAANWAISFFILIFSILLLGLISLHLYLIYNGLTTFEYIMNKRNSQIAPAPQITNTHLNEPDERSSSQENNSNSYKEAEEAVEEQSQYNRTLHRTENGNINRTENQMNPPISAFHNMQAEQKSEDFQSIQHIKSTHNKLPVSKQSIALRRSQTQGEFTEDLQLQNFEEFYKKHRGLKLLVGQTVSVKPRRTNSAIHRRMTYAAPTDQKHSQNLEMASQNNDNPNKSQPQ